MKLRKANWRKHRIRNPVFFPEVKVSPPPQQRSATGVITKTLLSERAYLIVPTALDRDHESTMIWPSSSRDTWGGVGASDLFNRWFFASCLFDK